MIHDLKSPLTGAPLAIAAVGLLAVAGLRRGSAARPWTVEDTDALLRAHAALRPHAERWARAAAGAHKVALLDAYERLPADELDALRRSIALTWAEEGHPGPRPMFRARSRHEQVSAQAGGLSLYPYLLTCTTTAMCGSSLSRQTTWRSTAWCRTSTSAAGASASPPGTRRGTTAAPGRRCIEGRRWGRASCASLAGRPCSPTSTGMRRGR